MPVHVKTTPISHGILAVWPVAALHLGVPRQLLASERHMRRSRKKKKWARIFVIRCNAQASFGVGCFYAQVSPARWLLENEVATRVTKMSKNANFKTACARDCSNNTGRFRHRQVPVDMKGKAGETRESAHPPPGAVT